MIGGARQTPPIGYRVDVDNPPYRELRQLLQDAFRPDTLEDFCREDPQFRELLNKFGSNASLLDMIREVLDHCDTRLLWEELLEGVAERAPRQYNRTAARLGWPLVEEPEEEDHRTPPAAYDDVAIHVGRDTGGGYPVTIQTSLTGATSGTFVMPWQPGQVSERLIQLERRQVTRDDLAEMGRQLFEALFTGHVGQRYMEAVGKTRNGLRLRLWLDAPELQALPWELLYDAERDEFLALSGRAVVTRYLSVTEGTPLLRIEPPLRMLVATASPRDQPPLDVDGEVAAIQAALSTLADAGQVQVAVLPHAQTMTLRDALHDQQPHVFHFFGHSLVERGGGALVLERDDGSPRLLSATRLRTLLRRAGVHVAVLNACLTARGARVDAQVFDDQRRTVLGAGPALLRAGLGAVVAMQFSIADTSARLFAADLYRSLAGLEPIDRAVSRAREALMLEGMDEGDRDWATPVLFLQARDGVIFAPEGSDRA
jgi:hypothetical protein